VKLYGPRIRVVQWLYEGSIAAKSKGGKTLGKRRRHRQRSYSSGDEYGFEEAPPEKRQKGVENVDGTVYLVLEDQASSKTIEDTY